MPHRWPVVDVVIPALDERASIPLVLAELPRDRLRHVVVVDNGSSDGTAAAAAEAGAWVLREPRRGYGRACRAGLDALGRLERPPDVVVFLDGDHSDHADELPRLVEPIAAGRADLVVGSRTLGRREVGALLPQARFGNWLASRLLRWLFGLEASDLGPFRAVRWEVIDRLAPADPDYGWTVELQARAALARAAYVEVPVSYRRRVGRSKISGTLRGSLGAGTKILLTLVRLRLSPRAGRRCRGSSSDRGARSASPPRES